MHSGHKTSVHGVQVVYKDYNLVKPFSQLIINIWYTFFLNSDGNVKINQMLLTFLHNRQQLVKLNCCDFCCKKTTRWMTECITSSFAKTSVPDSPTDVPSIFWPPNLIYFPFFVLLPLLSSVKAKIDKNWFRQGCQALVAGGRVGLGEGG